MKRLILLIASGLCALLMIGGMFGYTYEDSIDNVSVPMTGTAVGFADEPLTESAIPSALISPELTITWKADVWVGLVTEEEYQRCAPSDGFQRHVDLLRRTSLRVDRVRKMRRHSLTTSVVMSTTPLMDSPSVAPNPASM